MKLSSRLLRTAAVAFSLTLLAGYVVYSYFTPNEPPPDPLGLSATPSASSADSNTIELTLAPESVEFDGSINYGTPLPFSSPPTPPGGPYVPPARSGSDLRIIASKSISQPIFSLRKIPPSADPPASDSSKPAIEWNADPAKTKRVPPPPP